jgi:hypothetical protein
MLSLIAVPWGVAGYAAGRQGSASPAPASRLEGFERYIGRWAFTSEFLAQNPWAAEFDAEELDWGPRRNIVRMRETIHRADRRRFVFEGFAYWHPTRDKIQFAGYNVQERFFFEGEYLALGPDRALREYDVHYPSDYAFTVYPDLPGRVRRYRGERRLVDPDTIENLVQIRVGEVWKRWPDEDAKPFVMKRAAPAV